MWVLLLSLAGKFSSLYRTDRTDPSCFVDGHVPQDGALRNQTPGAMRAVWAPKVSAARALLVGGWGSPAGAAVLFSSVAGSLGSAGQANYGAANAALDGMATAAQQQVRVGEICAFIAWQKDEDQIEKRIEDVEVVGQHQLRAWCGNG